MFTDPGDTRTQKGELHMTQYLVVFHIVHDWPVTGRSEVTNCWLFKDLDEANQWISEKWMDEDVKDIQIYEYTGIQYVMFGRRHRDD